jgi:hypothetical protein
MQGLKISTHNTGKAATKERQRQERAAAKTERQQKRNGSRKRTAADISKE